jgi:hypothetical protein
LTPLDDQKTANISRRTILNAGAGLLGGAVLPWSSLAAFAADDKPAIGTWPVGSQGDPV